MKKILIGLAAAGTIGLAALAPTSASAFSIKIGVGGYGYGYGYGPHIGFVAPAPYYPACFVKKIKVWGYKGWHWKYQQVCY